MEGLSHILPEDYLIVVFKYGMAQELLWRVSWALNVIGHNVVDLSDFDWLTAIRRPEDLNAKSPSKHSCKRHSPLPAPAKLTGRYE